MLMRVGFTLVIFFAIELTFFVLALVCGGIGALFRAGFRAVFLKALWILALPPVVIAHGMFFTRNNYQLREVTLMSDGIPASFCGYRVVQISDIHLESYKFRKSSLRRMVSKVNELKPDLILFTGDLVTLSLSELQGMEEILADLSAEDGVLSILGNHDYFYMGDKTMMKTLKEELVTHERALGWTPLLNENVNISRGEDTISVVGVENISSSKAFPSYGNLNSALKGASGTYKILLSHDPSHWRREVAWDERVDLMLSGHTHEGQFRIFGYSPVSLVYKQHNGLYLSADLAGGVCCSNAHCTIEEQSAENLLYVNVGLGGTGLPSRIGVRPEITLFTLRNSVLTD